MVYWEILRKLRVQFVSAVWVCCFCCHCCLLAYDVCQKGTQHSMALKKQLGCEQLANSGFGLNHMTRCQCVVLSDAFHYIQIHPYYILSAVSH